ncbi:unnamed protein product [Peronospora belbahrii]|uniref:Rhodanese domain-containing protein n=1 Tax=Peronospora belbahrii TaxID=622444 RepID=A0AAU9L256_9STRA|nr:unnamed protein product [Peronospora belbahrii]
MQKATTENDGGTVVLNVCAHKEFLVGHFENALDPKVRNFSEYYAFLQNRVDEMKDKKVLMYCTGGIRCEKASNFLRNQGVDDVHQLKDGIHKYLEVYQDGGFFRGKNFVFDKRVLMGAEHSSTCIECQTPYDEFSGRKEYLDAETHCVKKKTPLEIAHEILVKNGYQLSSPQELTATTATPLVVETSESEDRSDVVTAHQPLTTKSPEMLTKEQLKLIETRRQEALARRRRVQLAGRDHSYFSAVIQPDSAEYMRHHVPPAGVSIQGHHLSSLEGFGMASSRPDIQVNSEPHRVVTPDTISATDQVVDTAHARSQCFWDDLEAAAEIVQWENEQLAEATLLQPPVTTATSSDHAFDTVQNEAQHHTEVEAATTQAAAVISLSQELLAAAEIIQWENEHEVSHELSAINKQGDSSCSDHEHDAPQFQLLPVDDFKQQDENLSESIQPHDNITSQLNRRNSNSLLKSNAHCMRPQALPATSALQRSSTVSSEAAKPSGEHQRNPTSSYSSLHQRDPTTEFIDKHLLEDKLEFSVLEFLDMMLA